MGLQSIAPGGANNQYYRTDQSVSNGKPDSSARPGNFAADSNVNDPQAKEIAELKARDQEVRTHEQAHKAAGGQYVVGGANYSYTTGPDGRRYAVAGEVNIDTSEIPDDPQATIQKMQQIQRAALAPAQPSGQDQQVAATAKQKEMAARQEAMRQKSELAGWSGSFRPPSTRQWRRTPHPGNPSNQDKTLISPHKFKKNKSVIAGT